MQSFESYIDACECRKLAGLSTMYLTFYSVNMEFFMKKARVFYQKKVNYF